MSEIIWKGRTLAQLQEAVRRRKAGETLDQVGVFLGVGKQRASLILKKYERALLDGTPMRGELDV